VLNGVSERLCSTAFIDWAAREAVLLAVRGPEMTSMRAALDQPWSMSRAAAAPAMRRKSAAGRRRRRPWAPQRGPPGCA
jgi:hypothetical protein